MKSPLLVASAILFTAGCQSESSVTPETEAAVATPAAFNTEGAPTVQFSVPDMMCQYSCVDAVKHTLASQPGAKDVKVEFDTKTAIVAIDRDTFSVESALAALVDKQFLEAKLASEPANASSKESVDVQQATVAAGN